MNNINYNIEFKFQKLQEEEDILKINKISISILETITSDLWSRVSENKTLNIVVVKREFIKLLNSIKDSSLVNLEGVKTTIKYKEQEIGFDKLIIASMELVETSFYPYYIEGINFVSKKQVIELLYNVISWYKENCKIIDGIIISKKNDDEVNNYINDKIEESLHVSEELSYGPTINLRIKSNPFKKENLFYVADRPYFKNLSKKYKNVSIDNLNLEFIKDIQKEFNDSEILVTFEGSKHDFDDFSSNISEYNKENEDKIKLIPGTLIYDLNRSQELKHLRYLIENSDIQAFEDKKMLEYFDMYLEEKNSVCVLATMSSGKSTLINSMIGTKLMPSKNEACTAKIMHLKNNNSAINFTDNKGNVVSNDLLKEKNDSDDDIDIYLEGPIKTFSDVDNFEIIDTPGPNNSQDDRHREITYNFIKSDKKHMVIVVLDGTKLLTTDEAGFIDIIAREQGEDGQIDKDRFVFVINKADELDDDDSEISMKNKVEKALNSYGIQNPKIHFVSALSALLARCKQNNIEISKKDERKLNCIIEGIVDGEYKFSQFSDISPSVKSEINKMIDEYTKNEDYLNLTIAKSGVLALELTIKEYMNKHKNIRKVKNIVKVCKSTIDRNDLMHDIKGIIKSNVEEKEELENSIAYLNKKIDDDKKVNKLIREINSIKFGDSLSKIEKKINKEFQSFKKEVDTLPFEVVNGKKIINTAKANACIKNLQNKYESLRADLITELGKSIKKDITSVIDNTINKYRVYVNSLCSEIEYNGKIDISGFVNATTPDFITLAKSCVIQETLEKVTVIENPKKQGFFGRLCFWRDDYIDEVTFHDKEGIELSSIIKFVGNAREDLHKLYVEIKETRENAKDKCLKEINSQVNAFNKNIKKDLNKLSDLRESFSQKDSTIIEAEKEFRKKSITIKNIKQKLDSVMAI